MIKPYFVITFFCVLVNSCDPGGNLLVKNGYENEHIEYNGVSLTFSLTTLANTNFSLRVGVSTEKKISIFTDSLRIQFKNNNIDYKIRYNEEIYQSKTINFREGTSTFFYGFDLDRGGVKRDDEIIFYAKKYIKTENIFYNLDTLRFIVTKEY